MDGDKKQLIYISDKNLQEDIVTEQKKYITDILNYRSVNHFFIKFSGFFYTGFTSFSKPIIVTCMEYNNFINHFQNFKISEKSKVEKKFDILKKNLTMTKIKKNEFKKLFREEENFSLHDLKNITNNKLLKHKLINVSKIDLVKYIRDNKKIYLFDTSYKSLILNNHLPYLDYDDLKQDLKYIYCDEDFKNKKEEDRKIVFDTLTKAINYAEELSKNKIEFVMLVIAKNLYVIYHKNNFFPNRRDLDLSDEKDNYKQIIEYLFGEEVENIINSKLSLVDKKGNKRDLDFIHSLDNYIIDNINSDYKISLNGHKNMRDKEKKVSNNDIDFDILYNYKNKCQINLIYKDKTIKLQEDFFLPEKDEHLDKIAYMLNFLWVSGYLMSDYDYNYYMKYDIILLNDIKLPNWFKSDNLDDLENLFLFCGTKVE